MKFVFLFIIISLLAFLVSNDLTKFRTFSYKDKYDWKDCVVPNSDYIKKEVPKVRKHFNEFIQNLDSIENFLHFIDLNNDKKLDVIYSGGTGAASDYVVFLLNTGDDYRILFEEYTNIRELEFENNKLKGYTGLDFGCCADYVQKETKYRVTDKWEKIAVYQRAQTGYTVLPAHVYDKPIKFLITKEIYKLRSSPYVDDTKHVYL